MLNYSTMQLYADSRKASTPSEMGDVRSSVSEAGEAYSSFGWQAHKGLPRVTPSYDDPELTGGI